ncbi:MAG: DNA primase [Flavobacteriales bacterium]
MINKKTIDEILETAQIDEVIGEFVELKKSGANFKALSPFSEERTPSFMVAPSKQIFKCFSSGKGGNVVSFLMEHEQMTYPEALRFLAKKYNIEIEEDESEEEYDQNKSERESLYVLNSFAQQFFIEQMNKTDEGKSVALKYFKDRGYSKELMEKFKLGYCPDSWEYFTKSALEKGYQFEYLEKSGLTKVKENNRNRYYDFFRGRVIFPIHNLTGRTVGFGARTLRSDTKAPKYINTPENSIYDKSSLLYGMYLAKKEIGKLDLCYLVEGYTDVLAMHRSGIENVVATCGTSLTEKHAHLIRRYTNNVTILFDGDEAGIKASFRSIDIFLSKGMNVKVVLFPEKSDPDTFSMEKEPDEVKNFISKNAKDFIFFKANLLAEEAKGDPTRRASMAHEIVTSIAKVPDHILRSEYIRETAKQLELEEKALVSEVNKVRRKEYKKKHLNKDEDHDAITEEQKAPPQGVYEDDITYQEKEIIHYLLNFGSREIELNEKEEQIIDKKGKKEKSRYEDDRDDKSVRLDEYIIETLLVDEVTFENSTYNTILQEYKTLMKNNETPEITRFSNHENENIRNTIADISSFPYEVSNKWHKKFRVFINKDEEKDKKLKLTVDKLLQTYQLKRVEKMLKEVQEEIKKEEEEDNILKIMERQKELLDYKYYFASQLNRYVLR